MQDGGRSAKLNEVRAKMAAGYYSAPDVALKTAELILKSHPQMFTARGRRRSAESDSSRTE